MVFNIIGILSSLEGKKRGRVLRYYIILYLLKMDVLNVYLIINKDFLEKTFMIFNPRNSMMISRNDGKFNRDTENQRDTIIIADCVMQLSRNKYTEEELMLINNIKERIC